MRKLKTKRKTQIMKKKQIDFDFYEWFKENWLISGGLISQATASKILNKTTGRIAQMIREGKIKNTYKYKNISFVSTTEIMTIAREEAFKQGREDIENIETLLVPKKKNQTIKIDEEQMEEIKKELKKLLEEQERIVKK